MIPFAQMSLWRPSWTFKNGVLQCNFNIGSRLTYYLGMKFQRLCLCFHSRTMRWNSFRQGMPYPGTRNQDGGCETGNWEFKNQFGIEPVGKNTEHPGLGPSKIKRDHQAINRIKAAIL